MYITIVEGIYKWKYCILCTRKILSKSFLFVKHKFLRSNLRKFRFTKTNTKNINKYKFDINIKSKL